MVSYSRKQLICLEWETNRDRAFKKIFGLTLDAIDRELLRCVLYYDAINKPIDVTGLSAISEMPLSTVSRRVRSLTHKGWVEASSPSGKRVVITPTQEAYMMSLRLADEIMNSVLALAAKIEE